MPESRDPMIRTRPMRRLSALMAALAALILAGVAASPAARAGSVDDQLARARSDRRLATRALAEVERRVADLTDELRRAQANLDDAIRAVLSAYQQQLAMSARLAEAQE